MPNWTHIQLVIERVDMEHEAKRQVQWEIWRKLFDACKSEGEEVEPFNILRPIPQSECDNWHDWCTKNWGTKWDLKDASIEFDMNTAYNSNKVILEGNCAWCEPHSLAKYLDEVGFCVELYYYSLENGCWGMWHEDLQGEIQSYIDVDDVEDEVAVTLYENYGTEIPTTDQLIPYVLGANLDGYDYLLRQAEMDADYIQENYEEWIENNQKYIDYDKKRRHKVMELLEVGLEDESLNEGEYLELCNYLKRNNVDVVLTVLYDKCDARDITDYLEPELIDYYKEGVEQNIIDCY